MIRRERLAKDFDSMAQLTAPGEGINLSLIHILVIPKLANAKTGDTLTAPDFKVTYDAIRFPQPLYTVCLLYTSRCV